MFALVFALDTADLTFNFVLSLASAAVDPEAARYMRARPLSGSLPGFTGVRRLPSRTPRAFSRT
ncbi:hypothetical protein [Deinococcus yavapaiensis]|uniref:Uncharacterized protein n=1 Tax=Deinococcus yavapaiensis KR-236 TaxID=694435 RepID=A0A318SA61_9DEIO|nr:hypothetical protein [Deinococcus yavapaiensis]PYE54060.1 hypothetical protein DES52_10622 [Deinococcus yavapaiensis KR-236]